MFFWQTVDRKATKWVKKAEKGCQNAQNRRLECNLSN